MRELITGMGRMNQIGMDSTLRLLREVCGFAFDLDGTIWEGPVILPGAIDLVTDLRTEGLGVVFVSNCSRSGSRSLSHHLGELGITVNPAEVLTPVDLVGEEVKRELGTIRVLVLGTEELSQVLASSGHTPIKFERWQEAKAVVLGVDLDFDYSRLRAAARAIASGASFFAINLDNRFPVGPGLFDPGCGALAAAIAVASGVEPVVIGKPQPTLFHAAIERLGYPSRQTAMVGDSQASDIKGGREAGMCTVWLDPENSKPKPDYADLKVRNLCELHQLWKQARSENTRTSRRTGG
jgi:HAD superfamily hydrolase (TIGR01450 family)